MRPTLSIWVRCHREPWVVRRLAALIAPHADEVVVAFETDMPDEDVAVLAAARADRLVAIPYVEPSERANAWVHAQCAGDWTLRLDYDEVPSAALLRALPKLVADPDAVAYYTPRLWTWPDGARVLTDRPWRPDPQLRLLRPQLVRFSTTIHAPDEPLGPVRWLEPPIYHLDLVLTSPAYRSAKAASYAAQRAMPDVLGRPFNDAYYLPELSGRTLRVADVPAEDRLAIAYVIDGPEPRPGSPPARIARAGLAEIDAANRAGATAAAVPDP